MESLLTALLDPATYDHPSCKVTLLETHISWVLLTGPYAYKIKKPVKFSFLDFSTLEKRRKYCEEEVRLNRRFDPDLYLDVVAITEQQGRIRMNGSGRVMEYAVRMRQFEQQFLLSNIARAHQLDVELVDKLADVIAKFHEDASRAASDSRYGDPQETGQRALDNFHNIRPQLSDPAELKRLGVISRWTEGLGRTLAAKMVERKHDGHVRECHGDLHLGNMVLLNKQVTLFDCIEFNDQLRWIDTINEVAFVYMDLRDRAYTALAYRFLNQYLERSGDYPGITLLCYYSVYRAMVRAKVALLRSSQDDCSAQAKTQLLDEYSGYIRLAQCLMSESKPLLVITHGVTGSGKSTATTALIELLGAIRVRSDVERKRLFGLRAGEATNSGLNQGIYDADADRRTYTRLGKLANIALDAGYPVIVDATFLQYDDRTHFADLARQCGTPFVILDFVVADNLLRDRVLRRKVKGGDPSEADLRVLEAQLHADQPLADGELDHVIRIESRSDFDPHNIVQLIQQRTA